MYALREASERVNVYKITFPERKGPTAGEVLMVRAVDSRDAWDKMHREYPFERIEVQAV